MPRPPTLAILLVLLLAPTAQAGLFDREVTVHVAAERAGDRMSYELARTVPQIAVDEGAREPPSDAPIEKVQRVVLVEGAARATDAYGIERETIAYRIDLTSGERVEWGVRCHRLAAGAATVRVDHLGAGPLDADATRTTGPRATMSVAPTSDFERAACVPGVTLVGRELREGDRLAIEALDPEYAEGLPGAMSEPAEATTFEERDALAFLFTSAQGTFEYVLADGLPAYAQRTMKLGDESGGYSEVTTLVGYAPGEGVAIAAAGSATLPERNPNAAFAAPDPLALDDVAYDLAFPYADAYAAIIADPTTRFSEWLAAHPDAVLAYAMYARGGQGEGAVSLSTRGTWDLGFADGSTGMSFHVVRTDGASTPIGPLAAPTTSDRVTGQTEYSPERASTLPAEIAESASLVALASAHGIDANDLSALQYVAQDPPYLQLTQGEGDGQAIHLVVDPARAAASSSYTTTRPERGLLGFFTGGVQGEERSGFSAIVPPSTLATGAAAATGLGLLILLLLPLFTRLRRDHLLDNPVRARLYERIRAEPGLHRAELVDFAGIGEGATRHHLSQLANHRLVVETAQEGFVRYFAAGEVPPAVARREALLRAGSHREVYELYAREPTISLREAGHRLGMSAPSVHRAKKKLEHAGLLPAALDASASVAEA